MTTEVEHSTDEINQPKTKVIAPLCSRSQLNSWSHTSLPPALHLGNSGNTCYINAILQALLATPHLLGYLQNEFEHQKICPSSSSNSHDENRNGLIADSLSNSSFLTVSRSVVASFCALCELIKLVKIQKINPGNTIWNDKIVRNVKHVSPTLSLHDQEDAHEFLLGLLSKMEECSLIGIKDKLTARCKETNPVRKIFGGVIRSQVTCQVCRKPSIRDEPMFNLSLDITAATNLQNCLQNYTKTEELRGANAYNCENCKSLKPAHRRCTIQSHPRILIIQFNRFSRNQKIDTNISFHHTLNLRPFMTHSSPNLEPVNYLLYATVNHRGGSCRSGHYIAYCRRQGQWQCLNDESVRNVTLPDVLKSSPYLLFYQLYDGNQSNFVTPAGDSNSDDLMSSMSIGSTSDQSAPSTSSSCPNLLLYKSPNNKPRIVFHKSPNKRNFSSGTSNGFSKQTQSFNGGNHLNNGEVTTMKNGKSSSSHSLGNNSLRKAISKGLGNNKLTNGLSLPKICLKRVNTDTWASQIKDASGKSTNASLQNKQNETNPLTDGNVTNSGDKLLDYPSSPSPCENGEECFDDSKSGTADFTTGNLGNCNGSNNLDSKPINLVPEYDDDDDDEDDDDCPLTIDLNPDSSNIADSQCFTTSSTLTAAAVSKSPIPSSQQLINIDAMTGKDCSSSSSSKDISKEEEISDEKIIFNTSQTFIETHPVKQTSPTETTAEIQAAAECDENSVKDSSGDVEIPTSPPPAKKKSASPEEGVLSESSDDENVNAQMNQGIAALIFPINSRGSATESQPGSLPLRNHTSRQNILSHSETHRKSPSQRDRKSRHRSKSRSRSRSAHRHGSSHRHKSKHRHKHRHRDASEERGADKNHHHHHHQQHHHNNNNGSSYHKQSNFRGRRSRDRSPLLPHTYLNHQRPNHNGGNFRDSNQHQYHPHYHHHNSHNRRGH